MIEFEQTKKLAEQGDTDAQNRLGLMYANGDGVKEDFSEVVRWWTRAAEQGDAKAQYNLGLMYYYGKPAEQNHTEALKWLTKAAEQGDICAKYVVDRLPKEIESEKEDKPVEQGHASEQNDPTSPSHYKQGGIECIDAIRAMTSAMRGDGFKIACLKDVVKYVWRHEQKNGLEDLKKAQVYLNLAIEQMENEK